MKRLAPALAIAACALVAAACGGGSHTTQTSSTPPPTATAATSGGASAGSVPAAITTGSIHATLRAENHRPVIKKNWSYTVTASDSSGRPLSGTVFSQFLVAGQVVGHETPPTHHLKDGHLHDVIVFPPQSAGVPVTFETVIHTHLGSVTLGWAVKVVK
ncbi:MAG TPA: hypothetical protein VKR21_03735 [Solirubrobacteraceae bacterium]|nr:hypothetical protein [Solirubrobacteraceae bacterium]